MAALFMAIRSDLLRFLAVRRVGPEEAEDLLQDVFVKLSARPTGPVAEPRAYLYRMVDNLLLDSRRASARRRARESAWTELARGGAEGADESPGAIRELIARERLRLVSERLAALPERTLLVFRRFRVEDVPQREVAAELGISLSAVEKHLQRAYRVLVEVESGLDAESPSPRRLPYETGP
jgi:RNA polymerase sigma-70 factor (ECF subfamily)